jgi:hypothetical protein
VSGHGSSGVAASLDLVEEAKRQLMTAVPSPRGIPSRSIAEALLAFEERLRDAADLISASEGQTEVGERFAAAIAEALRRAERLRFDAPPLDYESLVSVLADLIEPLDASASDAGG